MNRRGFIQITATVSLPILLGLFPDDPKLKPYSIKVRSNRSFGHLLRTTQDKRPTEEFETDFVIVGGGIAGVAAAAVLKDKNFLLFEADDRLGGSSASGHWKTTEFAMGAHYELAYPKDYGQEVINLLLELDVISFNPENQLYEFVDSHYTIPEKNMENCFHEGNLYEDVLTGVPGIDAFYKVLEPFEGKMLLPTRKINSAYHYLNTISFKDFLASRFELTPEMERRIDYQMLDDWGGKCSEVSALAGIHYYTCRPYNSKNVPLFSPPNGNAYFLEKMVGQLENPDKIKVNTMVRSIRETEKGVEVETVERNGKISRIQAKKVIYAGQKHALKYVLNTEKPLFDNQYAPWIVLNIVCKKGMNLDKWQNDIIANDDRFLGFVNSAQQKTRPSEYEVLTAYYCFPSTEREDLVAIEEKPTAFVSACIDLIEKETGIDLADAIYHVNVNLMGHAMPIPAPGYLNLADAPAYSENIFFAGVDTGRLPLFFEACDSGIQAGNFALKTFMNEQNQTNES